MRPGGVNAFIGNRTRVLCNVRYDEVARSLSAEYDVVAVRDGVSALALARHESWDLVLANITLPQLDGLALLRQASSITWSSR